MFKKIISFLLAFSILMGSFGIAFAVVHVNGYYRKNGTYVAPYTRTSPNNTKTDNYSYPGNYNPNTGKITPGSPDIYTNYSSPAAVVSSYYSAPSPKLTCIKSVAYLDRWVSTTDIATIYYSDNECKKLWTLNLDSLVVCPANSTLKNNQCYCNIGYINGNGGCITNQQFCENLFGQNIHVDPSKDGSVNCQCNDGFKWSYSSTTETVTCVFIAAKGEEKPTLNDQIELLKKQIQNLTDQLAALQLKK